MLISQLQDLDFEEFAEHLRDNEGVKIGVQTIIDIVNEVRHPFQDTRGDCQERGPIEAEKLFELLTAETDLTLRKNSLVFAKFVRFEAGRQGINGYTPARMHVQLQGGSLAPSTSIASRTRGSACRPMPTAVPSCRSPKARRSRWSSTR